MEHAHTLRASHKSMFALMRKPANNPHSDHSMYVCMHEVHLHLHTHTQYNYGLTSILFLEFHYLVNAQKKCGIIPAEMQQYMFLCIILFFYHSFYAYILSNRFNFVEYISLLFKFVW